MKSSTPIRPTGAIKILADTDGIVTTVQVEPGKVNYLGSGSLTRVVNLFALRGIGKQPVSLVSSGYILFFLKKRQPSPGAKRVAERLFFSNYFIQNFIMVL